MRIRQPPPIPSGEITPRPLYQAFQRQRRALLSWSAAAAATALCGASFHVLLFPRRKVRVGVKLPGTRRGPLSAGAPGEVLTPYENVTGYNNFYEFGADKTSPSRRAGSLLTRPWTVRIDGEVHRPQTLDIDHFLRSDRLEERVYRLRCVEAWSMVIPWIGVELGAILQAAQPTAQARFVAFETLHAPAQFPEQRGHLLPWPYAEGLRIDEAMHPLTILAVGLYGEVLPPQNGAPLRLVVPWKYGFKSIKSIVRIRLCRERPPHHLDG